MSRKPQTKLSLSAIYTRRYRERLRTGKVRLPILVDEADLVVMLIDRGLLNPLQADDRAALTAGAEQALRELCETSQHGGATYDKLRLGMCLAAQKRKMMMDGEKKNIKGNSISLLIFPDHRNQCHGRGDCV